MDLRPCEWPTCTSIGWVNVAVVIDSENMQTDGPGALLCETHYDILRPMLDEIFEWTQEWMPLPSDLEDDDEREDPWLTWCH